MKKILTIICAVAAMFVCSCSKNEDVKDQRVAVLLPSGNTTSRWIDDANYLSKALISYGYAVTLYTADETEAGIAQQVNQLKKVIEDGFKTIVITPIDQDAINKSGLLQASKDYNIICYDRMIMDNDAVDFYVACNPSMIGQMQAQFLLGVAGSNNLTIEYFAGPKSDKNSALFYDSAYSLLKKNTLLSVPSNKTSYADVALDGWSQADAKKGMAARLQATKTIPDLILAPNDNVAAGIIEALEEYQPGIQKYPVITGQDCNSVAKANIILGKQAMTIYKDYEFLAESTALVVNCFMSGLPIVTSQSFHNGKINVPSKYTSFTLVTAHNINEPELNYPCIRCPEPLF